MYPLHTFARTEIRSLSRYNAGLSIEAVRQRFGVDRIAKLGSNENPLGPSAQVIASLAAEAGNSALYPDLYCSELRAALSEQLGVDETRLVFGNGSEDLISVICRVFLDHGDQVVTVLPSFGLHILYPQAAGAEVVGVPMGEDLRIDVNALMAAVTPRTRMLMFSCPSNPVGSALRAEELQYIVDHLPRHTLLVLDEAYFEYAAHEPGYPDCLKLLENSGRPYIILRTFSKAYALAGLRIGYGITSDPALSDLIDRLRTPFNVNRSAQAAAIAALADKSHLTASIDHVRGERRRLEQALKQKGLNPVPSLANFLFFSSALDAEALSLALLRQGVIVKPWREKNYLHFLRVSVGRHEDNDLFLVALEKAFSQSHV